MGIAATVLHLVAVVLPLFGQTVNLLLIVPLGLSQLALVIWLGSEGFRQLPEHEQLFVR
jgi:hypothetical protein